MEIRPHEELPDKVATVDGGYIPPFRAEQSRQPPVLNRSTRKSATRFSAFHEDAVMQITICLTTVVVVAFVVNGRSQQPKAPGHAVMANMPEAVFKNYQHLKWDRILSDLGESSPEICILHRDPKTNATKVLNRTRKGIHVRKRWHSANETHTVIRGTQVFACDGKRIEQCPGSFKYLPAKMVHEAWLPAGSLVFITVDGAWDVNWVEGAPTVADLTK